jgi:hypothetical protein
MTATPLQHLSPETPARNTVTPGIEYDLPDHADQLWMALIRARTGNLPQTRAHSEDAVFRFYLPLSRALAQSSPRCQQDPAGAEQAAELGLAQAVLAWPHSTGQGFDRAARGAITYQLRQIPGRPATKRRRP